jgi:hypothetical protein
MYWGFPFLERQMSKHSEQFSRNNTPRRDWLFEIEPFHRSDGKSFGDLVNDLRLKRFLKKAVEKEFTPQSLIDSIKNGIRR